MIYGRYFQKVHSKWSPREKLTYKYHPVPGCYGHRDIIGETRGRVLFRNYCDRPQAAHALYWRSHANEYEAFLKHIGARRKR